MTEHGQGSWLTVEDVAKRLQVSAETVRRWIRAGQLPVLDLGGPKAGYRIKEDDLNAFLAARYGRMGKLAA